MFIRTRSDLIVVISLTAAFLVAVVLGVVLAITGQGELVTCQFKNMTQEFQATVKEASADSSMITVTQGSRTFMFRRDNLTACFDADETT